MPDDNKAFAITTFTPYVEKAGEEYMNIEQRKHFSMILASWKQELMEEVDRTKEHMQSEAN
ncbi:MAG: RNA polymerase-binding protein DksA, partial [Oleispira sp.]|nr:RNA polymerase-binding protein DksA [Oleispira sp.]